MSRNFQGELLEQLRRLLAPLVETAASEGGEHQILEAVGWNLDAITGLPIDDLSRGFARFASAVSELDSHIQNPPRSFREWVTVANTAHAAVDAIAQLGAIAGASGRPSQLGDLGADLINLLAVQYLQVWRPFLYRLCILLGIIEERRLQAVVDQGLGKLVRVPITIERLDLAQIPRLIRDLEGALRTEYGLEAGLTNPDATADKLFPRLAALLQELDVVAGYGLDPTVTPNLGAAGTHIATHTLTAFKPAQMPMPIDGGFGATFSLDAQLGLVVRPYGAVSFSQAFSDWFVQLATTLTVEGFALSSDGVTFPRSNSPASVNIDFIAVKLPPADAFENGDGPTFLVGSVDGTRLELSALFLQGMVDLRADTTNYGFMIRANKGALVIKAGDGDGFVSSVLTQEVRIEIDLGVGWSQQHGLHFESAATLDRTLPVSLSFGDVLSIKAIQLGIRTDGNGVDFVATGTAGVKLGPISATVDRLGLLGTLTFPSTGGNLGPLDLALGFKPPSGIGLAIDASAVKGGGFLFHQGSRYVGAVELSVFDVKVKAFGVIDTVLPDGREGYSFAIIISAEFTPIELGLGFRLKGVGGLIGINRGFDAQALGDAVRNATLGDILFPRAPDKDAPVILDRLATLFPPADGRYTFGPTAKIGWGAPTLVEGDFAIVLELPGPRVALLGRIRARLPKPEKPLVNLNMDIAGAIDFPKRTLALDASLFDSHVGGYAIRGDMAFRLSWGGPFNYVLAIGGFNPHFQPPPGFPKLRRVEVDLGITGNPSVRLSGYLALTSNTAQIGAKLQAWVEAGATLSGTLAFDALFTYRPFSFIAEVEGSVRLSFKGKGFSLHAHGTVEGPAPWRIDLEVCISVLFWDICVGISKTLDGSPEPALLPEVDVWRGNPEQPKPGELQEVPGLMPAIADARNWSAALPPGGFVVVTLAASAAETLLDPLGVATLRQRVVPFAEDISRFANRKLTTARRYRVEKVEVVRKEADKPVRTTIAHAPIYDYFARGQFQELSKDNLLSLPSFESLNAGVSVASDALTWGTPVGRQLDYTTLIFDAQKNVKLGGPYTLSDQQLAGASRQNAVARRGIRLSGVERFYDAETKLGVFEHNEQFALALKSTLDTALNVTIDASTLSKGTVLHALAEHLASHPWERQRYQLVHAFELRKG
jgi:hypothetical protein